MNFYYNCFKYANYFGRGNYLFHNNDDCAKTLGDAKPKHYHIYMYTKNKAKSCKATVSNIIYKYGYNFVLEHEFCGFKAF